MIAGDKLKPGVCPSSPPDCTSTKDGRIGIQNDMFKEHLRFIKR